MFEMSGLRLLLRSAEQLGLFKASQNILALTAVSRRRSPPQHPSTCISKHLQKQTCTQTDTQRSASINFSSVGFKINGISAKLQSRGQRRAEESMMEGRHCGFYLVGTKAERSCGSVIWMRSGGLRSEETS